LGGLWGASAFYADIDTPHPIRRGFDVALAAKECVVSNSAFPEMEAFK
jgi:hypothetical protein